MEEEKYAKSMVVLEGRLSAQLSDGILDGDVYSGETRYSLHHLLSTLDVLDGKEIKLTIEWK